MNYMETWLDRVKEHLGPAYADYLQRFGQLDTATNTLRLVAHSYEDRRFLDTLFDLLGQKNRQLFISMGASFKIEHKGQLWAFFDPEAYLRSEMGKPWVESYLCGDIMARSGWGLSKVPTRADFLKSLSVKLENDGMAANGELTPTMMRLWETMGLRNVDLFNKFRKYHNL